MNDKTVTTIKVKILHCGTKAKEVNPRGVKPYWYCQSQCEFTGKCKKQCEHCKAYYKPLDADRKNEWQQEENKLRTFDLQLSRIQKKIVKFNKLGVGKIKLFNYRKVYQARILKNGKVKIL